MKWEKFNDYFIKPQCQNCTKMQKSKRVFLKRETRVTSNAHFLLHYYFNALVQKRVFIFNLYILFMNQSHVSFDKEKSDQMSYLSSVKKNQILKRQCTFKLLFRSLHLSLKNFRKYMWFFGSHHLYVTFSLIEMQCLKYFRAYYLTWILNENDLILKLRNVRQIMVKFYTIRRGHVARFNNKNTR